MRQRDYLPGDGGSYGKDQGTQLDQAVPDVENSN